MGTIKVQLCLLFWVLRTFASFYPAGKRGHQQGKLIVITGGGRAALTNGSQPILTEKEQSQLPQTRGQLSRILTASGMSML